MNRWTSGSIGGAADEAGGAYRRGIIAVFAAHGLNGLPVAGLPVVGQEAVVQGVAAEIGFPVDDVLVQLERGRLFIQAKRSLGFGRPLQEVAAQWVAAVRDQAFDVAFDLIAAAGGELSGPVRALAQALDRRRQGATTFSTDQGDALDRFAKLLRSVDASSAEVETILSRGVILQLQVETSGHEDADRGRLLLDGHVVVKGQGGRAWRELLLIAGEAARLQLGHSVPAWLAELRKRDIPLTVEAAASRSAYLASRDNALGRYRQGVIERGENVDLTAIGLGIPPIPLSEMDGNIRVYRADEKHGRGDDLLWVLRRRGRITLTGLPGGGKSTALGAAAAEWARRQGWSVPILVSLKKLAAREAFRKQSLRDQLLHDAVEGLH